MVTPSSPATHWWDEARREQCARRNAGPVAGGSGVDPRRSRSSLLWAVCACFLAAAALGLWSLANG